MEYLMFILFYVKMRVLTGIVVIGLYLSAVPPTMGATYEGHEMGEVTFPCGGIYIGDILWFKKDTLAEQELVISRNGNTVIRQKPWDFEVDISGDCDLHVRYLRKTRDEGTFSFQPNVASDEILFVIVFVVPVGGVAIVESNDGVVSVPARGSKSLSCAVTGLGGGPPKSPINFCWTIDTGMDTGICLGSAAIFSLDQPDKSMNQKTIACIGTNYYTNGEILGSVNGSAVLDITYLDDVHVEPSHAVMENSSVILKCGADANPVPHFKWTKSGITLSDTADYLVQNAQRTAAGVYTCHANNSEGSSQNNLVLSVLYPPQLDVTHHMGILNCTATGVPGIYNFSQWEHTFNGKMIRTLPGISTDVVNQNILHFPSITHEDMGSYTCVVFNGIGSPQRKDISLLPETPAVFQKDQGGEFSVKPTFSVDILVTFYLYPAPYKVQWTRTTNGEILESHREETRAVGLSLHGVTVNVEGYVSILTLTDMSETHVGNYSLTVTNSVGGALTKTEFIVYLALLENNPHLGAIIGGVMSGMLVLVVCLVVFAVWYKRRRSTTNKAGGRALSDEDKDTQLNGVSQMYVLNNIRAGHSEKTVKHETIVDRDEYTMDYNSTIYTPPRKNKRNITNGRQPAPSYGVIKPGVAVPGETCSF